MSKLCDTCVMFNGHDVLDVAVKIANTGHIDCMNYFHSSGNDITVSDESGFTILHLGGVYSSDMLKLLIYLGCDPKAVSDNGYTTLMNAYTKSNVDILLSSGVVLNATDMYGRNALHYIKSNEVVVYFIDLGMDVNHVDSDNKTILHLVIREYNYLVRLHLDSLDDETLPRISESKIADKFNTIVTICNAENVLINKKDNKNQTALHFAITLNVIDLLLNSGADLNNQSNTGYSLLHMLLMNHRIIINDNWKTIHLIKRTLLNTITDTIVGVLNRGINVHLKTIVGDTALFKAYTVDIIRELINHGAKVNVTNNSGNSALHMFMECTRYLLTNINNGPISYPSLDEVKRNISLDINAVCNMYLNNNYDVFSTTDTGDTLMHVVGNIDMVDILLKHGLDINVRNLKNQSPLMTATSSDIVYCLAKHGAQVDVVDDEKCNALHFNKSLNCIGALVDIGVCVTTRNNNGVTPMYTAYNRSRSDIWNILIKNGGGLYTIYQPGNKMITAINTDQRTDLFNVTSITTPMSLEEMSSDVIRYMYHDAYIQKIVPDCIIRQHWPWLYN